MSPKSKTKNGNNQAHRNYYQLLELKQVARILDQVGVTGYSIINGVTGTGDRGEVINDLETSVSTNVYIISACHHEKEKEIVEAITPILKKYGGVCIVSDAKWIAH